MVWSGRNKPYNIQRKMLAALQTSNEVLALEKACNMKLTDDEVLALALSIRSLRPNDKRCESRAELSVEEIEDALMEFGDE